MAGARERFGTILEARLVAAVAGDSALLEAARYHLATGGKRLRGLLPPWIAASYGADPEVALDLGVGLELIHNGTLVHDDVQDGDTHRRGVPTVWARFGMSQAVNVGTTLMFVGLAQILRAPAGTNLVGDVNLAIVDVIAGQALELELQSHPSPTTMAWERMALGKTGALFSVCFLAATHAAGQTLTEVARARSFGARLGLFFQLQDDLLDLVGDKGREVVASDIAEGKVSWPVAWSSERAAQRPEPTARLLEIIRKPRHETSRHDVSEALRLLWELGAIDAGLARVGELARELTADPLSRLVPGLVEGVLDPIRHAL